MSPPFAHVAGVFAPIEVFPITIAAILYWHRAMVLSWDGRPVPLWRQVCFGAGLATIAIALFSPIGHIAEELVIAHMGEHLLIGDVASLLLVLGLTRSLLQPVLAIRAFNRLQVLTHPARRPAALGAQLLPLARAGALRRRLRRGARSTRSSTPASSPSAA